MGEKAVKVIPQFLGRLGNNMFQIAAAIGYAERYNVGWGITKGYIEPGFRVFQVDQFMPHLPDATRYHFKRYNEMTYDYRPIPFNHSGIRIVGFFQSEKYFIHCKEKVIETFNLPYTEGWDDWCSIHARRGDYVELDTNFPPVTIEYFRQAIPIMRDHGYHKFFVCSDGVEWCEEVLPPEFPDVEFHFSKGRNEWQDMSIMSSCGANIIANSSFSWWGAYLNKHTDRLIISPHHTSWYGPQNGVVYEANKIGVEPCMDLIPDSWIKIKFR